MYSTEDKGKKVKSFNRTFMELKFGLPDSPYSGKYGFNRTFMELKYL